MDVDVDVVDVVVFDVVELVDVDVEVVVDVDVEDVVVEVVVVDEVVLPPPTVDVEDVDVDVVVDVVDDVVDVEVVGFTITSTVPVHTLAPAESCIFAQYRVEEDGAIPANGQEFPYRLDT